MDRSLSRRPRGGCEARVRRGTRWCGTGASEARSRNDDGGRLAPRFLGGFRPLGARSVLFLAGADASLAAWPCGFVFSGRARRAEGRADGEARVLAGLWGCCGSDDAGPRGWTLPWRSTNQVTTTTDPPTPPRLTGLAATCSWHFRPCVEPQKAPRQPKNMQVSPAPTLDSPRHRN